MSEILVLSDISGDVVIDSQNPVIGVTSTVQAKAVLNPGVDYSPSSTAFPASHNNRFGLISGIYDDHESQSTVWVRLSLDQTLIANRPFDRASNVGSSTIDVVRAGKNRTFPEGLINCWDQDGNLLWSDEGAKKAPLVRGVLQIPANHNLVDSPITFNLGQSSTKSPWILLSGLPGHISDDGGVLAFFCLCIRFTGSSLVVGVALAGQPPLPVNQWNSLFRPHLYSIHYASIYGT